MKKIKQFLFHNTSAKQTVAKNTIWLFSGEIVGRILKLAIVVFATRKLGVEGWGLFSYALAFVSFFYVLGDFGINTFLTREMSRESADRSTYLATSVIVKLVLLGSFFIASLLIGPHIGKIALSFGTVLVFSTFLVFESLREFALSINRSMEKMEREGFSKILINAIITVLGIILIIRNNTPLSLALAYMTGSIVSTIYIFWSVRNEFKGLTWKFSKEQFKILYEFSWPLIILGLFSFIFSIDSIMLGQMKSATDVGLYAASQRLVQFLTIIPTFIAVATFPILSKNEADAKKLANIFEKVMVIILATALPLMIGGLFFSRQLILLVLGHGYIAAVPVLTILMLTTIASFPNIMLTNVIFSKNLQRIFILASSFGVVVNVGLNFWLIPAYGAVGAAISTVAACGLIMTVNWIRLKKFVPFSIVPKLGKILMACLGMTIAILACNALGVPFIGSVLFAIAVYTFALYILKEPAFTEILSLIRSR